MKRVVFLDSGVLGVIVHPRATLEALACLKWLRDLLAVGVRVCVPEVSDYELRRELVRKGASNQLRKLDRISTQAQLVPIATPAMREAANLWAEARNGGYPTAHDEALDGDVILCAQAKLNAAPDEQMVVATTDVSDLSRFVPAATWRGIVP